MNSVFIACSLDGYIAEAGGKIDFLDLFPMPEDDDMGYAAQMNKTDAILMGRKSFETVLGFGIPWPYTKPVFVWTNTLAKLPDGLASQVQLISGSTKEVLNQIQERGYMNVYVDGGMVIQSFLQEDLIDEMTITTIPVLLGAGISLFGKLDRMLKFRCIHSRQYPGGLTQSVFVRDRESDKADR